MIYRYYVAETPTTPLFIVVYTGLQILKECNKLVPENLFFHPLCF